MKKYKPIFILFAFFLLQNTEGYAQYAEPAVDTTQAIEGDEVNDENTEETPDKPYKNAFEEPLKQYYSEDVKQQEFDNEAYKKATAGLDYSVKKKEQKKEEDKKKEQTPPPDFSISPIWATIFQWFFIIGAVLILGYLVAKFADGGNVFGRRSRKIATNSVALNLEHIEENLHEVELDPHIKKAITDKQFALATRLYYLAIVKELSVKNVINFKKDKTNRIYLNEMRNHPYFSNFRTMTGIYERVWYGDTPIDEPTFLMIQPAFQDLLKILRG